MPSSRNTDQLTWLISCLVVRYTKSWSVAWQWKGSPGSLPGQAEELLLHQLPRGRPAASSLSGLRRSSRDARLGLATWRYSAPLKRHVRQIASCYVRLLWCRLCSAVGPKHKAITNECDWSPKKNVRGYPERLKEQHGLSPYGCLHLVFEKASVIILVI